MKKKSTSQLRHHVASTRKLSVSAFFNLRVLIGLFIGLTGVSLALLGFGAFSVQAQQKYSVTTRSIDPLVPAMFDCSKIHELGIDKQENFRAGAIMIYCGLSEGGKPARGNAFSKLVQNLMAPLAYGGTDVNLITGTETFPSVTQSETYTTANPDNPSQIVVNYNDSSAAPSCYAGVSVSTDGGATFTRLNPCPFCTGHGTNFGDPIVIYSKPTSTFVAMDLATGCGGQGIGTWTSTDGGVTWSVGACAHNGGFDDRESAWVDNNSSSPFFGRMYVSWNDFTTSCGAGGCLFSTHSSDGGVTWSAPVEVQTDTSFFSRNVQVTGDLAGGGNVYIASMDEGGGGFPHNDTNYIYKSTDGGVTWTNPYIGTPFPGPGVTSVGYFAQMFNANGGYWRHEGWGEPAAFNNVVHLVYAQHGAGSDPGDVFYIRSTDGGVTFGAPLMLNTDGGTRPQWQPNLSVSPTGTLLATWYDARVSADTDCAYGSPTSPCYQMFSRKSNDNGANWLPDDTLSDVVSNLPAQPDGNVQGTYAGDYDYGTAITTKHLTSWDDGRVAISGTSQQNVFTDRELVGFSVTTTDPACGSLVTGTAPVQFVINLSDAVNEGTVQPTDFTVNGTPADSDTFGPGDLSITFTFNPSPVITGVNTMHIPAGAFTRQSDGQGNLEFLCTFRYGQTQLAVTTTVPPVGGTFTPPAPGTYTYDVNFNEPVDPTSVQTSDLQLSGNTGATVTNVTVINSNMTTEFTLNIPFGGSLTAHIAAGAITDTFGNPNADFSGNYTVAGCPPSWSAGPDLPSVGTRIVGVFFPANGKFYGMGGRSSDTPGNEFTHPFEYDPVTNSWTTRSATYPDIQVNNMACGVLNESGTDYIYCVGGSDVASQTTTGRVFRYDPVTDTLSSIGDPWPPGATTTTLPGGFSVFNNKLFLLGGFNIPGGNAITDIWEFDPTTNAWVQKAAVLPVPLGYIPTTTIGNFIYTGGGSDITGGLLTDTTNSFKYDPVADSISTIAPIPRATGETRALNFNGQMYVMGGGRTAPNPSNEVDIYDPGTDTWSIGIPFVNARRNFPADTDGTDHIWLAGGYEPSTPAADMEIFFHCPQATPTPTPTVTPTATPTVTPTVTPSVTPTATPTVTPTPHHPTPRPRPTPHPRPTP